MSEFRQLTKIDRIIIHCADWPNGDLLTVEMVDKWHQARGFSRSDEIAITHMPYVHSFGYHYFIAPHGGLSQGRALYETGAHTRHQNIRSVGICLAGRDKFSAHQWRTLAVVVTALQRLFPQSSVHGHNEFSTKTCPGFSVREWLAGDMSPLDDHLINGGAG